MTDIWMAIRSKTPLLGRKFKYIVATEHYSIENLSYQEAKSYAEHYYYEHRESVMIFKYDKNNNKVDVREFIPHVAASPK